MKFRSILVCLALLGAAPACGQQLTRLPDAPPDATPLAFNTGGRADPQAGGGVQRQWPGSYFEAGFSGPAILFRIGDGKVSLRVAVDGGAPIAMVAPEAGLYRLSGLEPVAHTIRIDVVSESIAAPTNFGGFMLPEGTRAAPLPRRPRMVEFIGDSHTVGYGNASDTSACTRDEVWAKTDTSRAFGPIIARHYVADYQVNAISGRGIVRNYDGFAGDTLPQAYPYILFDKAKVARNPDWRPQVIVIALGTNDFSTPLKAGEPWADRAALGADYERTYVRFVQDLRARNPHANILLWATDIGGGEVAAEVAKVADTLNRAGDARVGYLPVRGLAFSGCDGHPNLADDTAIADAIIRRIDAMPDVWAN